MASAPGNSSLYLFLPWVQILHRTVTVRIQTTPECTGRIVNVCLGSDQELGFLLASSDVGLTANAKLGHLGLLAIVKTFNRRPAPPQQCL